MVRMGLSAQSASDILGLPLGADLNSICMRYKQLSIKWHPEKHKYSSESQKKFKQVALAYKRLTVKEFQQDLDINECLSLFQQLMFCRSGSNGKDHSCSDSSDDSDDGESDDSIDDDRPKSNGVSKNGSKSHKSGANYTSDLTEDEKEKTKAEKRRLRKKRQKERKRSEKEQQMNSSNSNSHSEVKGIASSEQGTNPVINKGPTPQEQNSQDQMSSSSFTKVVGKKKKSSDQVVVNKKEKSSDKKSDEENEEVISPKVLRSRQLAIRGNEMAQMDQYTAAIELFTEAINLEPSDYRFFGNRSYCYDRIEQFDKALRDAEKAIKLDKNWAKGYFRKGRALAGLKMFAEAEKSFMQVLKLDKGCDDAVTELQRVRTHQLMDMGFSRFQSEEALKNHGSVQAALDYLLASVGNHTVNDLYITDDEDEGFSVHRPAPIPPATSHPTDVKMDPTNPEGLTALWVGNVLPTVTEKRLNQLFSKFGQVTSVRPLPEKFCAFVNFKTKESAGRAMHQLQGTEIDGQKLLIKFPDNPLTNANNGQVTIRKPQTNVAAVKQQGVRNTPKQSGPVNGDECYFWRTTGCTFGGDCKWQHLPNSRGVDKKPWQK